MNRRPLLSAALCAALGLPCSLPAAELPPGFVEEIAAEGLGGAMSMGWGPDGELFVGGQQGDVWIVRNATLATPRTAEIIHLGNIPTSAEGERGILGIAVDPDYRENRAVWLYYSRLGSPARNRLSRFRHVGDQLADETVILETEDLLDSVHNGGCLRFASDKTLYLSTGDDGQRSATAQNPHDLRGKILHINRDGSPAAGNPFLDGEGGDPRVWALGLRNPWRFNLQPRSENLFIGDVGADAYEEVNLGVPGGNYGWALTEGPEPPAVPGVIYPIHFYPLTSPLGHAIIGGDHVPPGNFPPEYTGNYLFADAITREIFRMVLDASNQPLSVSRFASDLAGGPVDLQFGPDGRLYYVAFEARNLVRIRYAGGENRQPVARASATPDHGEADLEVTLDGSESFDPEGDPLHYSWDLGNGARAEGPIVQVRYPPGVYLVSLTVTDHRGGSSTTGNIRIVAGNTRPSALMHQPAAGRRYVEGEWIAFEGQGIDPEEGWVPCEQFTWTVIFHHRAHTHPFLGPLHGVCGGGFLIDSHGEEETFYEIQLTVTDTGRPLGGGGALTGTQSREIHPGGSSRR